MAANIDLLEILRAAMAVDTFMRQRKEQQWGPTAELVKQQGFEAGEQQLGTKQMMDFYKYLFKQEPGQKTTIEPTRTEAEGEALLMPKTRRVWPQLTTGQRLEQAGQQYLGAPGKAEQVVAGRMGEGTLWEKSQAEATKRYHAASLAQPYTKEGIPGAQDYFTAILEGRTPETKLPPLAKESDKWEFQMKLGQIIGPLYGQEYASLDPTVRPLVDSALSLGIAQIADGKLQPIHFKETEAGPPSRLEFPIKGKPEEQQVRLYDKKGKLIETGVQPRWKPGERAAGGYSQKQWGDEVDSTVVESFLRVARDDYENELRRMGKSQADIDASANLRAILESITTRDPLGGIKYNIEGLAKYLSPENKKMLDTVRRKARGQYSPEKLQDPVSTVQSIIRSEPSVETPQTSAEEFMKFLIQKEKGGEQPKPQTPLPAKERTIRFQVGNRFFDIPQDKVLQFRKDNPNAVEVR